MNTNEQKKNRYWIYIWKSLLIKKNLKKRNDLEIEIIKSSHELFILQQNDVIQTDIKTIKEAFEQLQQQEHDLYHVFRTLIQKL